MKVGIVAHDAWMGGIVYTHNLVRSLSMLPDDERLQVSLFCKNNTEKFKELLPLVKECVLYRQLLDSNPSGKWMVNLARRLRVAMTMLLLGEAQPELAWAARRAGVDVLFSVSNPYTRFTPSPIAWIPDLQHKHLPHLFSKLDCEFRDRRFSGLLKRKGQHVVFSSKHALNDAIRFYGQPQAQTHILHFATVKDADWEDDPSPVLKRYALPKDYLIVCNQFWVHKDHATLFEAIGELAKKGRTIHLVCTGETSDYRQPDYFTNLQAKMKADRLDAQIHILGMIPRYDQIMLIKGSLAIVQPSLFEGWSTVLEDARALGKFVIASDFPVHLEQNLPRALYFRQKDAGDCATVIETFLSSQKDFLAFNDKEQDNAENVLQFAKSFLKITESVVSDKLA